MRLSLALLLVPSVAAATTLQQPDARTDSLERVIRREMARREIPGLSIAVIDSGRIVLSRGYGVTRRGGPPVTEQTLFQAGSISKPVAAVAAMRLVSRDELRLDRDINEQLVSWKLRDTSVAEGEKVTVRHLLSHTAGLNVQGFRGYDLREKLPTAVDVLNAGPGTNTPAVRIERKPGVAWRYSGGGYTILQVLMSDVSGTPFPELMQREVLTPAGMTASTYAQPLPASHVPKAATGYLADGSAVPGGWHAYPEMAAAGLWTTPADLARFAIAVQRSYRRMPNSILPPEIAAQMLAYQRNDHMGLGFGLRGNDIRLEFSHGGRDEGFDSFLAATALTGQGVVIMINANDNSTSVERIRTTVARLYGWPNERPLPVAPRAVATSAAAIDAVSGRYEVRNNVMLAFERRGDRLLSVKDERDDEEFVPVARDVFTRVDGGVTLRFLRDSAGALTGFESEDIGGRRRAPRVGPFVPALRTQPDPDPVRTTRLTEVLRAISLGQVESQSSAVAPGALNAYSGEPLRDLVGIGSVRYVGEENVKGRGISRHGGAVARIVYLGATIGTDATFILVHLTDDGRFTDLDLVKR
ncbi:MAG: serine hydrolase domain-containing protein [Gemmatimonadaceae bacterium]